jgi:chromosome segregation ATPase
MIMSYWKADAAARAIPPESTRDKLTEALETIFWIASALECDANEESILDAIEEQQERLEIALIDRDELQDQLNTARDQLAEARGQLVSYSQGVKALTDALHLPEGSARP